MSHDPSRKRFFAKLIGIIAATGLASKLLAKPQPRAKSVKAPARAINLRLEGRAVARRDHAV